MDLVQHLRTFLAVARLGSMSAAARETGTVPSVISKRISQLEHMTRATLFERTSRGLELTAEGRASQRRFAGLLSEIESTLYTAHAPDAFQDRLRIRCPTTLAVTHVGPILHAYRARHPGVRIDLDLIDRSVNPLEEGYDLSIGGMPSTYPQVRDFPLAPMPRRVVAAPEYFADRPRPTHPSELGALDCLIFRLNGSNWVLQGANGQVAVDVNVVFSTADTRILVDGLLMGAGVALVSAYSVDALIAEGRLIEILPGWTVPALNLKALVPERQADNPAVTTLVEMLTRGLRTAFDTTVAFDPAGVPSDRDGR